MTVVPSGPAVAAGAAVAAEAAGLGHLAGLLADHTRAAFCLALFDGRAWTAGELASVAGVAPSTASEHLDKLIAGGLLVEWRQGRHRYVQLAGAHVAELIEDLSVHVGPIREPVRSLRAANAAEALARGRTCYDHLAGRLGVAVTEGMTRSGLLQQATGFALTDAGIDWLTGVLGVETTALEGTKRPMVRACVDWTERRPHLAGIAGAAVCQRFFDRRWIVRAGHGRAVNLTRRGAAALDDLLGIDVRTLA